MTTDKTASVQRGRPFEPGVSGNPNGRPRGSRNKTTLALESLLDGQATALTQKAIDLALAGDMAALRLCLDRILPPRKDRPVTFTLPPISSARDAAQTVSAVLTSWSPAWIIAAYQGRRDRASPRRVSTRWLRSKNGSRTARDEGG